MEWIKLPEWTELDITADIDNKIRPEEIYLVPNEEGQLVPKAWRLGRVYEPCEECGTKRDFDKWKRYVKTSDVGLKVKHPGSRRGPALNNDKSREYQRVVLNRKKEITWISDQLAMILK